ncbi:MAG: cobyric acid synthase [Methanomicrobiales archaeon]
MSLMVLGTASHVGKSLTVAAICRVLADRGIPVAPFKSQNMSLNSYVTADGAEIGIAQAVQAAACRVEPSADMNPVLIKPKGDQSSQIMLLGRPFRDVHIAEYYRESDTLLAEALAAYRRLESVYGTIIVEGAGGAAELNLYDRDIANIRLARELRLPVILVADIERGGVFAQVYGTCQLLPDDIRPLVAGVIITKFRGDPALFSDGVRMIEDLCGIPVLGVIPFSVLALPSEDSLSLGDKRVREGPVRIAVVRFPRISNFTDFEVLERYVPVDYVPCGGSLSGYDCVILPGTKNTVADLTHLKESGGDEEIRRARARGVPIIGICGGYQMLGKRLLDEGTESAAGSYEGLGILDCDTSFTGFQKTTVQVVRQARPIPPLLDGMGEVCGYEIHMGQSRRGGCEEAFAGDGAVSPDGLVVGTYMHGLFHNRSMLSSLFSYLFGKKGLTPPPVSIEEDLSLSGDYAGLSALYQKHADMDAVVRLATGEQSRPPPGRTTVGRVTR